ncbi:hypothetical protein VE04_06352 [Pseudogymnoascus sp. 24MN13]|nr:hypothetical protein VE04_06352 [Pseudogymnoascus sp. 24MN13]
MLDRASGLLSKLRWRNVVLTIVVLTIIHFAFLDDTLQNAYKARAGKVADAAAHPELSTGANAKPAAAAAPAGNAATPDASSKNYADEFGPIEPSPSTKTRPAATTIIPTPTSVAPVDAGDTTEHVAICLAIKDQYADLTEFLTHHYHHLGIRRFYLMDDGSSPAITHRYYHPAQRDRYQQLASYTDCLRLFGHKHKWIAFIDADEFLYVSGNETLNDILKPYDDDDTVGAFGGFTRCIEDQDPNHPTNVGTENEHIKVLVKAPLAISPDSPHKFKLKPGVRTVGENGDTVDRFAWRVPITRNRVSLHHYATRSREEYEAKISRGNGMGDPKGWDWWKHVEAIRTDECLELAVLEP